MAILPDEPRGIGQVLDSGFRLYFKSIRSVFLLALIAALINGAPDYWLYLWTGGQGLRANPEMLRSLPAGFGLLWLVAWLSWLMLYGAIILRMYHVGTDTPVRLGEEIGGGFRALAWMVIASILVGLVCGIGFVLLVIPGIFLSVSLAFYSYSILIDRQRAVGGMNHSYRIVRGNWFRTAAVLTVALLIVIAIGFAAGLAESLADVFLGMRGHPESRVLIGAILNALLLPLSVALGLAQYEDLKVRKQGGDLEARIGDAATA
ncbi:MAG TPA: hypothetical protein VFA86_12355 [Gammaproteobacteria bacterium]|nr:hypothetical protein [Gammaproteobacteria bacterium]